MRFRVKHLNLTESTSTISLLSPLGSIFSNHLEKVAAGYCRGVACPKGRLEIGIKGNEKKKTGK